MIRKQSTDSLLLVHGSISCWHAVLLESNQFAFNRAYVFLTYPCVMSLNVYDQGSNALYTELIVHRAYRNLSQLITTLG